MAGCTVPNTWPIIPTDALTATGGGGMDPINDLSVDAITAADAIAVLAPKVLDIQNFMKISRGFTYGDTGTGNAGNATTGTVGTNYQTAAIPTAAVVAADTTIGFTLSNITFSIVRYEFADKSYTDSLNAALLDRGHEFSIYFKNYQTFTGTSTLDKTQSMRISVSSQSLNYVMGTFQAPNRTTITQPINTLISPPQAGEAGL
jgi:hypothetical protein